LTDGARDFASHRHDLLLAQLRRLFKVFGRCRTALRAVLSEAAHDTQRRSPSRLPRSRQPPGRAPLNLAALPQG